MQQDGDHNGAIAEFRESIRLDPANSGAHYNLARALTKTGDTSAAATEFAQVRSIQQAKTPILRRLTFNVGMIFRKVEITTEPRKNLKPPCGSTRILPRLVTILLFWSNDKGTWRARSHNSA